MGLALAIFVPEGVVFVSDGLAEIRNSESDNGFLHKKQKCLFSFKGRYLVCVQGSGYIKGIPYSYFINQIFAEICNMSFASTKEFCVEMMNRFIKLSDENDRVVIYVAGIDKQNNLSVNPMVYIIDGKNIQIINKSNNGNVVYNYHAIGRSLWVNKLLLPTFFEPNKGERIDFENLDIDFSKYSLKDAVCFGKSMIEFSYKMDSFVQLKQMVGEYISVGCLSLDNEIRIKDLYE